MKIIKKSDAIHVKKPEGVSVDYYLRDEYEVHYDEQAPGTTQTWHHHEELFESLFILEGELITEWKENGAIAKEVVGKGDLIEPENTPHTFTNHTDRTTKFIVIQQILSGENKREILKTDKIVDE
jgi:mannose-6-phosphate isomerase-like protein (cupin superfamily)